MNRLAIEIINIVDTFLSVHRIEKELHDIKLCKRFQLEYAQHTAYLLSDYPHSIFA